jgi:hypothetical protein
MFGLEKEKPKAKKNDDFVYELERELANVRLHSEIKRKVEARIQQLKNLLRTGESKEEFDRCGQLLHGYTSLLKVMSRFKKT